MKKYELTTETKIIFGVTLFRIKALINFSYIKKDELGGWIEKESNLCDNAWVSGNAKVYGNAEVYGDAKVYGDAEVYGDAKVYGNAWVYGNAEVSGNAKVYGNAEVYGDAKVCGDAKVYGDAILTIGSIILLLSISKGYKYNSTAYHCSKTKKSYIKLGCYIRTVEEWDADFDNNINEFPIGSIERERRMFVFLTMKRWLELNPLI